jgi:uncharacterized protein YjbI with pentapeptide repeats
MLVAVYALAALIAASLLIWGGYVSPWTGFRGKTLWEWLQLLVIPAVLAGAAFWFNWQQTKTERALSIKQSEVEREIAQDQQRETALQTYLGHMTELLLIENLRTSQEGAEVRQIARIRTLMVLRILDARRNVIVLRFLQEAGLRKEETPIVNLRDSPLGDVSLQGMDLTSLNLQGLSLNQANLNGANLSGANLSGANLSGANLSQASMIGANLSGVILNNANLSGTSLLSTDLSGAFLFKANLNGANLSGANLDKAYLSGAQVTPEQLAEANSLKEAIMPDGTKHD